MNLFRRLVFIAAVFTVFSGCGKVGEEVFGEWWPYDREGATKDQKGSSWQILEEKGNFSLFLKALELTDYKNLVNGSGLVTVFAPTNAAFREYLMENYNTADLNLIDQTYPEELNMLVAYHLIQFSYSPDDFLAFSVSSSSDKPQDGDGTAFKYQTVARKPIVETKDPITLLPRKIFHREEYLPVISTKLFKAKGSTDPEGDYKAIFPDANWIEDVEDRIYVGNAAVTEMGIPSDNGYLYVIDKVAEPLPTIYEALTDPKYADDFNEEYSYITRLFQTLSLYQYDANISRQYGEPGDSLFYLYSFKAPAVTAEMPEIGSEWTYHNEQGTDITKSMSWAVTAVIPNDEVFEAWMKEYFSEYFQNTESVNAVIDRMPYITLYQIAVAHLFDKRQIIIPSELYTKGVAGSFAENFRVDESEVKDIKFCSNGIIYGTTKVNIPYIFDSYVAPLFQTNATEENTGSTYNVYATAFMSRNMYRVASDLETNYSLFVISDDRLGNGRTSESNLSGSAPWTHNDTYKLDAPVHGSSFVPGVTLNSNRDPQNDGSNGDFINRALAYGVIPDPREWNESEDPAYVRYYQTRQEDKKYGMYIFSYNGGLYDQCYNKVTVYDVKEAQNGMFYEVGQRFQAPSGGINAAMTRSLGGPQSQWKMNLLYNSDLGHQGGMEGNFNQDKDYIMFAISDAAVERGQAQGLIPRYNKDDPEVSPDEKARLRKLLRDYCAYYMIDKNTADLSGYLLPGYGPDGPTNEAYSVRVKTCVEYTNVQDAKYITVSWDPNDPFVLTLTDYSGKSIKTRRVQQDSEGEDFPGLPDMRSDNGIVYVIDEDVFDYTKMFVEQ